MAINPLSRQLQREAYKLVLWQLLGVFLLAIVGMALYGATCSLSIIAGGAAYSLANFLFVWRVFRFAGAHQMNKFVVAFFVGEMIKLSLSAVLFLIIVKYTPVSLLSTLVGFIGGIVSFWMVCMWYFSKEPLKGSN